MRELILSRRGFLGGLGTGAAGLAALPAFAAAPGFTHGVASGDPLATRVILWTRFVPASRGSATVRYEVARDEGFADIVSSGRGRADPGNDYCVKVDARGLAPDGRYFYRFRAEGAVSDTGRTRTLPERGADRLALALFSCSNLPFGYFNAYAHCAARSDIDLALHVGDYIYEYQKGTYPSLDKVVAGRLIAPDYEIVSLTDYRARYASYRVDADLQAVHAALPFICVWDDHELTNDAWMNGAQNHQEDTEGAWKVRRRAAVRAYHEWMPTRVGARPDHIYRSFQWGNLATLTMLDTRLIGRMEQLDYKDIKLPADEADQKPVMDVFRRQLADPGRSMLGMTQERWLEGELARSARLETPWQIIGQQLLVGFLKMPADAGSFLSPTLPQWLKDRTAAAVRFGRMGLPFNLDSWGGYPAARQRLLDSIGRYANNTLVLAGDSHNAWAFELPGGDDGTPLAAEIGGQSVSSPGFDGSTVGDPLAIEAAFTGANPELKWCETARRGYCVVDITPARAQSSWVFMDTIAERSTAVAATRTGIIEARRGRGVSPWAFSA